MKTIWDERFSESGYVYGTEANEFLKRELPKLQPGKILFPAEGEGRNAVYAAEKGWEVWAYDYSEAGRQKALELARNRNVRLHYNLFSHEEAGYPEAFFDAVGLFYAHTPRRALLHRKVLHWLRPGGTVLLEAFSKDQLQYNSGGPRKEELLYSEEELREDFGSARQLEIKKETVELNEGKYHRGPASVIRMIAVK